MADNHRKLLSEVFCIEKGLDFEKMIRDIPESLISFCQNIKLLFMLMAVFGICMIVKSLYGRNPTPNTGSVSLQIIKIAI